MINQEWLDRHDAEIASGKLKPRCPLCTKHHLDIEPGDNGDKLVAHCFSPGCKDKGGQILHRLGLPTAHLTEEQKVALADVLDRPLGQPEAERADDEILGQVYEALRTICNLDEQGRKYLDGRGFTEEEIDHAGYGSWPPPGGVVENLAGQFNRETLLKVPGFFLDDGKLTLALSSNKYAGILIPVRDLARRPVAIKVRLFEPDRLGKMRTLSSAPWGGPSGRYTVHVPFVSPSEAKRVLLVEGELKADLVASRMKYAVVSVPGVNGKTVALAQPTLQTMRAESVGVAFDQDPAGWHGARSAVEDLATAEFAVALYDWPGDHKGLDDALLAGVEPKVITGAEILTLLDTRLKPAPTGLPRGTKITPRVIRRTLTALLQTQFAPVTWIVPGLIPKGLTILAAKPKVGKSTLCMDLAIACGTGTDFLAADLICPQGPVLYLDLEGTAPGSQSRSMKILGKRGLNTDHVHLVNSDSNVACMPDLLEWLRGQVEELHPQAIIIDTWARVRANVGDRGSYDWEYQQLIQLKAFAEEQDLGMILVHHLRKNLQDVDDLYDGILGSTALAGAVDTMALLVRQRDSDTGFLSVTGREVEHTKMHLVWDKEQFRFAKADVADNQLDGGLTAEGFLMHLLGDGEPMDRPAVMKAAKEAGFSESAIEKARNRLRTIVSSGGHRGKPATWRMPLLRTPSKEDRLDKLRARLGDLNEQFDNAVKNDRFEEAANLKKEQAELEEKINKLQQEGENG
jgi:hypothetical protein